MCSSSLPVQYSPWLHLFRLAYHSRMRHRGSIGPLAAVVERTRHDRLVEVDGRDTVDPRRRRRSGFRHDDIVEGVEPDRGHLGRGVVFGLFVLVRPDARDGEHQTDRQGQCHRSSAYHSSLLV